MIRTTAALLSFFVVLSNSSLMAADKKKIKNGATVSIHYTLTVDGKVVETTTGKDPYTYVHGKKQLVPGLEKQLVGLKVGSKKKIKVQPKDGYGEINTRAVEIVPIKSFKEADKLQVGQVIQGNRKGRKINATIKYIDSYSVILDFNHPLAGRTLLYEVEVVDIKPVQ